MSADLLPHRPAATGLPGIAADLDAGLPGLVCDEPALDGTAIAAGRTLTVRGWAFARGGLDGVFVTLDQRERRSAKTGLHRPDVARLVDPDAGVAGWQQVIDLGDVPEGEHSLVVVAVGSDGRAVGVEGRIEVRGRDASAPASSHPHPGAPERFVPEEYRGHLVAAEHLARYRWAAQVASGRDVLDAGSGEGYGAAILAEGGARNVVGVERDPEALHNAGERCGEAVELVSADLHELPFEADSFDLVVCFEAIEHVTDAAVVLDELRRVLRADGLLLISTPNRDVYPPGNPHHVHEYTPDELDRELRSRFAHVRLHHQNAHLASLVSGEEIASGEADSTSMSADVRKLSAAREELFTIAVAGDVELPEIGDVLMLGGVFEARELLETTWEWEERAVAAEADAAASRTEAANAVLARERAELLVDEGEARRRALEARLGGVLTSVSWRMTTPLRRAARAARRRLRP